MGRQKRIWYEGAVYHVMGRGNRHTAIYRNEDDYKLFMMLLSDIQEKCPFILHAYCLMTNHFHLELTTQTISISKIMQKLMNHYARNFNQKYEFQGHLFDSRYASKLIEDDGYFLEVSRYIHLNPVKAGMVRNPLDYEYSSYRQYISPGNEESIMKTDTSRVLLRFHEPCGEQYRMFVEGKISHGEQEMLIQKDINENDMWLPW